MRARAHARHWLEGVREKACTGRNAKGGERRAILRPHPHPQSSSHKLSSYKLHVAMSEHIPPTPISKEEEKENANNNTPPPLNKKDDCV